MWRAAFLGVGMGLAMPTLSAASVASLPPEVRGVGSGSLNTMRQVGFTIGVALVVAIFAHTVAQNARQATGEAARLIAASRQLGPAEKGVYTRTLVENAKAAAGSGGGAAQMTTLPLRGAEQLPGTTPATFKRLNTAVARLYRDHIAESFMWPFYAAAIAAFIGILPALLTGRRLGEHEGHHEMTRAERLKATARAEATSAGLPLEEDEGP
jgi:hypothetical protein